MCIICERSCDFCEPLSRRSQPVYLFYELQRRTLQLQQKLSQVIHRKFTEDASCKLCFIKQL